MSKLDGCDKRKRSQAPTSATTAPGQEDEGAKKRKKGDEQLDAEMEKRRQRVALWQSQRRKSNEKAEEEQAEREKEASTRKKWSLADEDEDDEDDLKRAESIVSNDPGPPSKSEEGDMSVNGTAAGDVAGDIDPLDAFMAAEILPEVQRLEKMEQDCADDPEQKSSKESEQTKAAGGAVPATPVRKPRDKPQIMRPYDSDSSEFSSNEEEDESEDDEEWAKNVVSGKGSKLEKLTAVDHSTIDYIKFRKNFFIESPEISKLTDKEVAAYRKQLDNIKVRGKNIPRPIKGWHQCGLSTRVLQVIKVCGFDNPMPIQAQALPVIMQGRDCIGIAKTGSGKTMAFVLPMMRHIKDQPPLTPGEGPVALIMAPTRELVQQIGKDIKKFARALNLTLVCVYGGSGVSSQITALKRGAEIVVCTPGRMIDILAMGAGKITNMRRVTYLVLDEADRMFDLGFEPQIGRILKMIRPDRQTVMFSATFPRQVESLARTALTNPAEIVVGGKSIVNLDIEQMIEVRPEEQRFLRLLELLGHWYERGKVLIFVSAQEKCDNLFRDLLRAGYPCMSLHGGKDQSDRECTISDFKSDVCNVLVATSVAARGLDVKDLHLVVNYDVPNHYEDYVHRVGRTGRAGKKGTAVTFIAPDEEKYAPDLVKALRESGQEVPYALQEMADDFKKKFKQGLVQAHGSGFGGSGFKFDEEEERKKKAARKRITEQYGIVEVDSSDDEGFDRTLDADDRAQADNRTNAATSTHQASGALQATQPLSSAGVNAGVTNVATQETRAGSTPSALSTPAEPPSLKSALLAAAQAVASKMAAACGMGVPAAHSGGGVSADPSSRAAAFAAKLAAQHAGVPFGAAAGTSTAVAAPAAPAEAHFSAEIEINDFPQQARWKVTHKDALNNLCDEFSVAITTKGIYVPPNKNPRDGERKLFLLVEGKQERFVKLAKSEIKKIIGEATEKTLMSGSRYQI